MEEVEVEVCVCVCVCASAELPKVYRACFKRSVWKNELHLPEVLLKVKCTQCACIWSWIYSERKKSCLFTLDIPLYHPFVPTSPQIFLKSAEITPVSFSWDKEIEIVCLQWHRWLLVTATDVGSWSRWNGYDRCATSTFPDISDIQDYNQLQRSTIYLKTKIARECLEVMSVIRTMWIAAEKCRGILYF